MILIDTSAWVEFLRGTGSATCERVDALLRQSSPCATPSGWRCSPVHANERHPLKFRGVLAAERSSQQPRRIARKLRRSFDSVADAETRYGN